MRSSIRATTLLLALLATHATLATEPALPPPPPPPTDDDAEGPPPAASVIPKEAGTRTRAHHVAGQTLASAMQSYLHAFLAISEKVDAVPVVVFDRTKKTLRITLVGDREATVEARSAVRVFRQEALVRTLEILEYAYETTLSTDDYTIEYRNRKDMKLRVRYVKGKFETP